MFLPLKFYFVVVLWFFCMNNLSVEPEYLCKTVNFGIYQGYVFTRREKSISYYKTQQNMRSSTVWESSVFHKHIGLLLSESETHGYINKLLSLLIKKMVYLLLSLYVFSPPTLVVGL